MNEWLGIVLRCGDGRVAMMGVCMRGTNFCTVNLVTWSLVALERPWNVHSVLRIDTWDSASNFINFSSLRHFWQGSGKTHLYLLFSFGFPSFFLCLPFQKADFSPKITRQKEIPRHDEPATYYARRSCKGAFLWSRKSFSLRDRLDPPEKLFFYSISVSSEHKRKAHTGGAK